LELIPVVDLLGGQVVHARKGQRSHYRPLQSSLCEGSQPETIVGALLALHPFRTLYIADLDAIQRRGSHVDTIVRIRRHFPALELWVDAGIGDEQTLAQWIDKRLGVPVIGSETMADAHLIVVAQERCRPRSPILSLDFMGDSFQGPAELLSRPADYWPRQILAMNLARVGSELGPDLALISRLMAAAPKRKVYAAGGVRGVADLEDLQRIGAAGALIASALHDGRLGPEQLARVTTPR
jgi:phosphoribosylformimino-5-aminoimidazole carboxamide ribotide isomerase